MPEEYRNLINQLSIGYRNAAINTSTISAQYVSIVLVVLQRKPWITVVSNYRLPNGSRYSGDYNGHYFLVDLTLQESLRIEDIL